MGAPWGEKAGPGAVAVLPRVRTPPPAWSIFLHEPGKRRRGAPRRSGSLAFEHLERRFEHRVVARDEGVRLERRRTCRREPHPFVANAVVGEDALEGQE